MAPLAAAGTGTAASRCLLIYDGGCGVCSRLAGLAARFAGDRVGGFAAFAELSDAELADLGLSRADCFRRLRFRDARARVHGGAFAVNRFLLAAAPPGWRGMPVRLAVWLLYLLPPLLLLEVVGYEIFGRYRSRISAWTGMPCGDQRTAAARFSR